ncbi:MAG: amino acid ABC transporter permease [Alphaproteobacteria bacterium]|nr:amino acid ABC transporter permease [Alphaproteobacteria bacterium]
MNLLADNAGFMLQGMWFTLRLAVATLLCAGVVSVAVGLMSVARARPLRALALCYVEFWRDIPLLVNLLFVYFGAPLIGLALSPFAAALLSLSLWGGANGAEIVRGGINAVPAHQAVSATALGMKRWEIYRYVILPQALMPILPPMTGLFSSLIQATSLASLVGVTEFFRIGQIVVERTTMQEGESPAFLVYGFVLVVYFVVCSCLSQLTRRLEQRLAARGTRVVAAARSLRESV